MEQNISQISDINKLADLQESEQIAGLGMSPAYLVAGEVAKVEDPGVVIDLSSVRASLSRLPLRTHLANISEDSPNYILNMPLRNIIKEVKIYVDPQIIKGEALAKKNASGSKAGKSQKNGALREAWTTGKQEIDDGLSGGVRNTEYENGDFSYFREYSFDGLNENSTETDLLNSIENELNETIDNYDSDHFYYEDNNGFMILDAGRMQSWYQKVRFLCGLLVAMQMLTENKHELRRLVVQELTGRVGDKGLDTKTIIGKIVQNRMSKVSVAFAELLEKVDTNNQERYDQLMEVAEGKVDGCGEKFLDWLLCGYYTYDMFGDMKKGAEAYVHAVNAMLAALQTIGYGGSNYGDSPTGDFNAFLDNMLESVFQDLPSILYTGDNGYLELDDETLLSVRNRFYATKNLRKAWNMINRSKVDGRNIVHEELTGISGREKSKTAEKMQEMEGQWQELNFSTYVNKLQERMFIYNMHRYLKSRENASGWQAFSNMWSRILDVIGMILDFFIPGISMLFSIGSGSMSVGSTEYCNDMVDPYKPDLPDYQPTTHDTNLGNDAANALNGVNNLEENVYSQVDSGLLSTTSDDYYALDYNQIAGLTTQLTRTLNLKKAIVALYKERASIRKLVHMEMTGVGGREMHDYVEHMNKGDFFKLEMLVFMLNEFKTAENMEIYEENTEDDAWRSFAISTGCSIGGSMIGGAAGSAGGAIGSALGSIIGGLISSIVNNTVFGSYGAEYGDSSLPAYLQSLRQNSNTTQNRLENLELEIYEDLLANGITDTGDGYDGLNSSHIATLRDRLSRVAYVKNAFAAIQKARQDARSLVHLEMTRISGRNSGDYVKGVVKTETEGALRTFSYLTKYLDERIEVQNRTRDAEKALYDSIWKMVLDVVIAAIFTGVGYAGGSAEILWHIMTPVIGAVNSAYDFIVSLVRKYTGFGSLENYNVAKTVNDIRAKNDNNSTINRLNELERQALMNISQELIEELGGGRWGVSSGAMAMMQEKLNRIYNIKDAIARIQAAEAEARATVHMVMSGTGGRMSDATSAFLVDRMVTQALARDLFRNLQTISKRHNQMNAAYRQMWTSLVQMAFSALSIYLSVRSTKNYLERKELNEQMKKSEKHLKGLEKELNAAKQANNKVKEDNLRAMIGANRKDLNKMAEKMRKLAEASKKIGDKLSTNSTQIYGYIVSLAETLVVWATGLIFDAAGGKRDSKSSDYLSQIGGNSSNKESECGWVNEVAGTENAAVFNRISNGETNLDRRANQLNIQQGEETLGMIKGIGKATLQYLKSLRVDKSKNYVATKAQKKALEEQGKRVPASAAPADKTKPEGETRISPKKQPQGPNSKVLLDRVNDIIQKGDEVIARTQKASQQASKAGNKLKVAMEGAKETVDLKELLSEARTLLEAAKASHSREVKNLRSVSEEGREYSSKVGETIAKTEGAIATLEGELKGLLRKANGKPDPVTAAKVKNLRGKINLHKLEKRALQQKKKELTQKIEAAKGKLGETRAQVAQAAQQVNWIVAEIERRKRCKFSVSQPDIYSEAPQSLTGGQNSSQA